MESEWFSLVEMLFVYGCVLAFLFWQLYDVNRASAKRKTEQAAREAARGADEAKGSSGKA